MSALWGPSTPREVHLRALHAALRMTRWRVRPLFTGDESILGFGKRDDAQTAYPHQRRIGEELVRLDLGQRFRLYRLSRLNLYQRNRGVFVINRNHGRGARDAFLVARVVDDEAIAGFHRTKILYRDG